MSEQLGLLPSQLRLLGRQCDEVKGQLGRLAGEQAVMGKRVEEVQRGRCEGAARRDRPGAAGYAAAARGGS